MAVNKVVYGGNTLIDLTTDTVAADKLLSGYTAHDATGNVVAGTATTGGGGLPATIVAGDTPVSMCFDSVTAARAASPVATGINLQITVSGTYRFKSLFRNAYSASNYSVYSSAGRFAKNGTLQGTEQAIPGNSEMAVIADIACVAGDVIEIYASSAHSLYLTSANTLVACIDWDNGF